MVMARSRRRRRAPGIGGDGFACGVGKVEAFQQRVDGAASPVAAQVQQVGHQVQVLLAGQQVVDGGELAGDADGGTDGVGFGGDVAPCDADLAGVGFDQGGQDLHDGGLAGAVGAQQGEHGALGDGEVDAVQDRMRAVGLAQTGH
jgi:hypothetical protein